MPGREVSVRRGGPEDVDGLLTLFDGAAAWLVARGQSEQWGDKHFSARPDAVHRVREWAGSGGLRLAHEVDRDGTSEPLGAVILGSRPPYVEPVQVAECYVQALVTSRAHAGHDIGGILLRVAANEAAVAGAVLLRVDCWAGAPSLVAWYERQGFARAGSFTVRGSWTGQVLARELEPSSATAHCIR